MELKDKKVGDWVYHIIYGWFKLSATRSDGLIANDVLYMVDGKKSTLDINPIIYTLNPFDPEELPPCEFKEGEVFMADDHGDWCPKIFNNMTKDGLFRDVDNRWWERARKQTPEERGE